MATITGGVADDVLGGTAGDDTILGFAGNDSLSGQDGNDALDGGDGIDTLSGGAGNDTLVGGPGSDSIQGDSGVDTLTYADAPAGVTVTKPQTASMITMGTASDGYGGVDTFGHGTADELVGSAFDDVLTGSPIYTAYWDEVFGNDDIRGGAGNDSIVGLDGDDILDGEDGNDTVLGGYGNDALLGGEGQDIVSGDVGDDVVEGQGGNDTLSGFFGSDTLLGGDGDDFLDGGFDNDLLDGGPGNDTATFGSTVAGAVGVSLATGLTNGSGGAGFDTLVGIENLEGSYWGDTLTGDSGANALSGLNGDDTLSGGAGNDTLDGGTGNDRLDAGTGVDSVDGGDGTDTLVVAGARSAYTLTSLDGSHSRLVNVATGEDISLAYVETVQFSDGAQTVLEALQGSTSNTAPIFAASPPGIFLSGDTPLYDVGLRALRQDDGKLLVVGARANGGTWSLGPSVDQTVLRFNADGSLDTTFSGDGVAITSFGAHVQSYGAALQSDGKLVIAGSVVKSGSWFEFALSRYNTDGSLDTSFSSDGTLTTVLGTRSDVARAMAIQSDGKILVGGYTQTSSLGSGNYRDFALVRYNADGTLDTGFNGDGNSDGVIVTSFGATGDQVEAIELLSGGQFMVLGSILDSTNLTGQVALARYNANGSLDTSFGSGGVVTSPLAYVGMGSARCLTVQPDGKFVVLGYEDRGLGDGTTNIFMLRFNADGTPDSSFGGGGKVSTAVGNFLDIAYKVVVLPDGDLLVGGLSFYSQNFNHGVLLRYNADGSLDTGFGNGGVVYSPFPTPADDGFDDITVQPDGRIVVAAFRGVAIGSGNWDYDLAVLRYNADGTLDGSFNDPGTPGDPTYVHGASPVLLNSSAAVYDAELSANGNYDGSMLTLVRHGGVDAQDVFAASGTLSFSGGNIAVGSTVIGTAASAAGVLTLAFNANATQSLLNSALRQVTFATLSETPGPTVQIDCTFNDGSGAGNATVTGTVTVNVTETNLVLAGTAGADVLHGFAGNDSLAGLDGDDTLLGGAGCDTLAGGAGNDFLDGGAIKDRIAYSDRNVLTYAASPGGINLNLSGIVGNGSEGSGTVSDGFGGTDRVANVNFIVGSAFDDVILGSSAAIFEDFTGGAGNDTIDGGTVDASGIQFNNNRVNYAGASGAVNVDFSAGTASGGGQGTDTLFNINQARGSAFNDTLTGSDTLLTEQFEGGAGNDTIDGKGGADIARYDLSSGAVTANLATGVALDGMGGTDTLINVEGLRGSDFNDSLTGGNPANGSGATDGFEFFYGNGGNDTIDGGTGYDRADYNTSPSGVVVTLGGTANGTAQDGFGGTDTLVSIEAVRGSAFADVLTGSDTAGFESFEGREGNDTIDGKGGFDRADYANGPSGVTVNLATQTAQGAWAGSDTLLNIEGVRGTAFNDGITGDAAANRLEGGAGNDTLAGGAGNDTLIGGSGVDTLTYDSSPAGVTVTKPQDALSPGTANDGFGTVDVIDHGTADILIGSAFDDVLTGSPVYTATWQEVFGLDEIHAGAGNDSVTGLGGNDLLSGDAGNDTISGGDGDDELDGGAGDDVLSGGNGFDIASYEEATGFVNVNLKTGVAFGADGSDQLSGIEAVAGSAFNDTLTGSDGDDYLAGWGGNDALDGGAGFDVAYYGNAAGAISASLATGAASGADGQDSIVRFEGVIGSDFDDSIAGDAAGNLLKGGSGNDVLDGGSGDDTLVGGAGDDTLNGGDGTDTAVFAGRFNEYSITSGSQPGRLVVAGPDGRDSLIAIEVVQFDDRALTYVQGTTGADAVTVAADAGAVIVDAGQGDDVLVANDSGNALLGGEGNDRLTGGQASDNLDGGDGNDLMAGGAGDDVYTVDSAGDVVTETDAAAPQAAGLIHTRDLNLGGGIDKVVSSISYSLGAFVENLTLSTGTADLAGTGNELGNVISGNAGSNRLDGLAGDDSLAGADGNDVLAGGAGNDTLDGGTGRDTAIYAGHLSAYSIVFTESGFSVTGPDGTDIVSNVERLEFDDYHVAFDVDGNAGQAYRLYQAAFNRTPDIPGLGYQMNALDVGWGLVQIAQNFIDSPEFSATYGALDNSQFVTQLYLNVLHRAPEAEGLAYHVARLESGVARAGILVGFSESPENQAALVGIIETGMVYSV